MLFGRLEVKRLHWILFASWLGANCWGGTAIFPIFLLYTPEWRCVDSAVSADLGSGWSKNCTVFAACPRAQIEYRAPFYSAGEEFELFCDNAGLLPLLQWVQFAGNLVGVLFFGHLTDWLGRKHVSLGLVVASVAFACATGASPGWWMLLLTRLFIGIMIGGVFTVIFVYHTELITPIQRTVLRQVSNWGVARTLFTLICFILQSWRIASVATTLIFVPSFFLILFFIPESPTWYMTHDRQGKAVATIQKIASFNGEVVPSAEAILKREELHPDHHKRIYTTWDVLRHRESRVRSFVLTTMITVSTLSSYSIDFSSASVPNFWANQFLSGIMTIAFKWIAFTIDYHVPAFTRRMMHQVPQSLACLSFGAIVLLKALDVGGWPITICNVVGIASLEVTWDAGYISATECFPTVVRAIGLATVMILARIGGMLSPVVVASHHIWPPLPYLIVTIIGLFSLVVSFALLPETKGKELPQEFADEVAQMHRVSHRVAPANVSVTMASKD